MYGWYGVIYVLNIPVLSGAFLLCDFMNLEAVTDGKEQLHHPDLQNENNECQMEMTCTMTYQMSNIVSTLSLHGRVFRIATSPDIAGGSGKELFSFQA